VEEKYYELENIIDTLQVLYRQTTIEPYKSAILSTLIEAEQEFEELSKRVNQEDREELDRQTNEYLKERY
jgi:hypothetical protein